MTAPITPQRPPTPSKGKEVPLGTPLRCSGEYQIGPALHITPRLKELQDCVYELKFADGKVYVGYSSKPYRRVREHLRRKVDTVLSTRMQQAIATNEQVMLRIISQTSSDELPQYEQERIERLRQRGVRLLNQNGGGGGGAPLARLRSFAPRSDSAEPLASFEMDRSGRFPVSAEWASQAVIYAFRIFAPDKPPEIYVGRTLHLQQRLRQHKTALNSPTQPVHRALVRAQKENRRVELLICHNLELQPDRSAIHPEEAENHYIATFRQTNATLLNPVAGSRIQEAVRRVLRFSQVASPLPPRKAPSNN